MENRYIGLSISMKPKYIVYNIMYIGKLSKFSLELNKSEKF